MSGMPTGPRQDWQCAAYGEGGPHDCFVGLGQPCANRQQCTDRMADVRQRVYRGIQERAAAGDPTMATLANDYTSPVDIFPSDDDT